MTPVHVTEVLEWADGKELGLWRGRVGNRVANATCKKALNIGTKLHQYVQRGLEKGVWEPMPTDPLELTLVCHGARRWCELNEVEPLEIEVPRVEGDVAFTPDLRAKVNGRMEIVDWKTSSAINWKHSWQVTAYCGYTGEDYGRIVRLNKVVGGFHELEVPFNEERWKAFQKLKDAYIYWRSEHADDTTDAEVCADEGVA